MTKKDFFLIAYALRNSKPPVSDNASPYYSGKLDAWQETVIEMMRVLEGINGRFDGDIFKMACGYTLQENGEQFRVDWTSNKIYPDATR